MSSVCCSSGGLIHAAQHVTDGTEGRGKEVATASGHDPLAWCRQSLLGAAAWSEEVECPRMVTVLPNDQVVPTPQWGLGVTRPILLELFKLLLNRGLITEEVQAALDPIIAG